MEQLRQISQHVSGFFVAEIRKNPRLWVISALAAAIFFGMAAIASLFRNKRSATYEAFPSPIASLPSEIVQHEILPLLDSQSLVHYSRVSKDMHVHVEKCHQAQFGIIGHDALHQAEADARKIENPRQRVLALARVVIIEAKCGYTERSEKTFTRMLSLGNMDLSLCVLERFEVACACAYHGNTLMASSQVKQIASPLYQALALAKIAKLETKRGDAAEAAKRIRRTIHLTLSFDSLDALWILRKIAKTVPWGQVEQAFNRAKSEIEIAGPLAKMARVQFKKGNFEKARQTLGDAITDVQKIQDPSVKIAGLIEIARAQLQSPDKEGARKTLREAENWMDNILETNRALYLLLIAHAHAENGDFGEAERLANEGLQLLKKSSWRDKVWKMMGFATSQQATSSHVAFLAKIARILSKSRMHAKAKEMLLEAKNLAAQISKMNDRIVARAAIAKAVLKIHRD